MDPLVLAMLLGAGGWLYWKAKSVMSEAPVSAKLSFLRDFGPIVLNRVRANGWPIITAPVLIAWAAMESNWGTSKLAHDDFNLFGIKAGPTWKAEGRPYVAYSSGEFTGTAKATTMISDFRKYASWSDSLDDLLKMLSITTIYKPAFDKLAAGDVQGFYQAIDASGYSTASNYSGRIRNFVDAVSQLS